MENTYLNNENNSLSDDIFSGLSNLRILVNNIV